MIDNFMVLGINALNSVEIVPFLQEKYIMYIIRNFD